MTTGRINQVTIAGRGAFRASPRLGTETTETLPHRSASSTGVEGPRSRTVKRPTLCKASHTSHQRRGSDGLAGQSPANPEESTAAGSTKKTGHPLFACTRSDATPTEQTAGAGRGATSPRPRAAAQPELPSKPGHASAGNTVPHAAPRQDARQSNVCCRFTFHAQILAHCGAAATGLKSHRTSGLRSPHSSLRTIIEFDNDPIPTRCNTDSRANWTPTGSQRPRRIAHRRRVKF